MTTTATRLFTTTAEGVALVAARCDDCGHIVFPHQDSCPRCVSGVVAEIELGPTCTLVAFTAVHHPTPGSKVPPPYTVGLVEFPEGIRVVGLLTVSEPGSLLVGQELTVVARPADPDAAEPFETYWFQP